MEITFINLLFFLTLFSCVKKEQNTSLTLKKAQIDSIYARVESPPIVDSTGMTIESRYNPPQGFTRYPVKIGSFGEYLRKLPLQPEGSPVKRYDGEIMPYVSQDVSHAIIDLDVGKKDLQQCADAIIRMRAEYFYQRKEYNKISFTLTNGFKMDFNKWVDGYRLKVKGNKTWWSKQEEPSRSYNTFRKYLDTIFMYAGTISMVNETKQVPIEGIQIGDIFVISDAHAVIVVDVCVNQKTGEKLIMLAQSYMPARSIHILKNHKEGWISPWYSTNFGRWLTTPQWTFEAKDLRRYM